MSDIVINFDDLTTLWQDYEEFQRTILPIYGIPALDVSRVGTDLSEVESLNPLDPGATRRAEIDMIKQQINNELVSVRSDIFLLADTCSGVAQSLLAYITYAQDTESNSPRATQQLAIFNSDENSLNNPGKSGSPYTPTKWIKGDVPNGGVIHSRTYSVTVPGTGGGSYTYKYEVIYLLNGNVEVVITYNGSIDKGVTLPDGNKLDIAINGTLHNTYLLSASQVTRFLAQVSRGGAGLNPHLGTTKPQMPTLLSSSYTAEASASASASANFHADGIDAKGTVTGTVSAGLTTETSASGQRDTTGFVSLDVNASGSLDIKVPGGQDLVSAHGSMDASLTASLGSGGPQFGGTFTAQGSLEVLGHTFEPPAGYNTVQIQFEATPGLQHLSISEQQTIRSDFQSKDPDLIIQGIESAMKGGVVVNYTVKYAETRTSTTNFLSTASVSTTESGWTPGPEGQIPISPSS